MSQSSILEDVLPTKLSRWIAGLIVPSAIAVSSLPLFQPLSRLVTGETETHLLQALLLVSTLLAGALACLISVVRAFNKWETIEKTHELKEIFQDIRFYIRKGLTDEEQMASEWFCTNCWTDKIQSVIQREGSKDNITTYFCPKCKTQFKWNRTIAVTTYNPFPKTPDFTDSPEYKAIKPKLTSGGK